MPAGAKQFGRYKVRGEIGRGAMGIVYQARDPKIERLVAIKAISVLPQGAEETRQFRERFFVEAQAAGRLSHPGIVTIYDVGEESESQNPYIVMEYIAGESLEALLSRNQGRLPAASALQLSQEIAEALDYAHSKGIIHRDIKPSNILVTEEGHAKIADFGVAKLNLANLTLAGQAFGTPAYMSPEQLNGDAVDGRTDLFSLGVILYAMLTGHRPFQGNSALTVSFRVVHREPLRASALDPGLPPDFDYVIERSMAKEPSQRYQSGREMALDLKDLLEGLVPRSKLSEQAGIAKKQTAAAQSTTQLRLQTTSHVHKGQGLRRALGIWQKWPLWQYVSAIVLLVGVMAIGFSASRSSDRAMKLSTEVSSAVNGRGADARLTAAEGTITRAVPEHAQPVQARPASVPKLAVKSVPVPSGAKVKPPIPVSVPKVRTEQAPTMNANASLHIRVEHHLTEGELYLWVDDKLVYKHALGGSVTKRMVVFKGVQGFESASVQLEAGEHRFRVRVESSDSKYDETRTIVGTMPSLGERALAIDCSRRKDMRLALQ
jgi:serine/threonine protein kinase